MADAKPVRRPYTGSCHCGFTKYIVFLSLPAPPEAMKGTEQSLYRCNCTSCHKAGHFHVHTNDCRTDILVLSPLNPYEALGDYQCFDKTLHWLFCKTCGMRCFIFAGEGVVEEQDLGALGVPGYEEGQKTKVWHAVNSEAKVDGGYDSRTYLSINGYTIDAKQEGFDLREWTEKKWVEYVDCLDEKGQDTFDKPHVGGAY